MINIYSPSFFFFFPLHFLANKTKLHRTTNTNKRIKILIRFSLHFHGNQTESDVFTNTKRIGGERERWRRTGHTRNRDSRLGRHWHQQWQSERFGWFCFWEEALWKTISFPTILILLSLAPLSLHHSPPFFIPLSLSLSLSAIVLTIFSSSSALSFFLLLCIFMEFSYIHIYIYIFFLFSF